MRRLINVFVVAPTMLCWGFERMVERAGTNVRVVGSAPSIGEASWHVQRVQADVVLVDYDEVLHAGALRAAGFHRPVLLLAPKRVEQNIGHWTRAGVVAVLPKDSSGDLLLFAIRSACDRVGPEAGVAMIQVDGAARAGARKPDKWDRSKLDALTRRERQLLLTVVCNSTTPGKVLAEKLCISEHTLRNHLTSIYGKLGVQNRLSLHDFALGHHLDEDPRFLQGDRQRRPGFRAPGFSEAASVLQASSAVTRSGESADEVHAVSAVRELSSAEGRIAPQSNVL